MPEETTTAAPTSFAEFEAAGGKYNPPAEPKPQREAPPVEEPAAEPEPEPSEEPEPATAAEPAKANGAAAADKRPAGKPREKLSLSEEHAKLLKEVVELRKERRELQQAPPAQAAAATTNAQPATAEPDKPPLRPKLSTFQGTLEEYEKAVEKYDEDSRKYLEQQFTRKQAEQQAQAEQQRIRQAYGEKLAEHIKAHPDYDSEIAQTPMTPLMVDIVLHEGPALGQALIDDKELAKHIQALPRDVQIFEMGKLTASLANGHSPTAPTEAEPEPEPVKVPAKLNATGGAQSAASRPDRGAKTFAQWELREQQAEMARRQRYKK